MYVLDIIHPVLPEDWKHGVRSDHAVEQTEHNEEERQNVADDGEGRCESTDPLAPAANEDPEEQGHEKHVARRGAVGR